MSFTEKHILLDTVQENAIKKIFLHIDGVSIGTTIHALYHSGMIERISNARIPISIKGLANEFKAKEGYLHVAMRLFTCLGLLKTEKSKKAGLERDNLSITPTKKGYAFFRQASRYAVIPSLMDTSLQIQRLLDGDAPLSPDIHWEIKARLKALYPPCSSTPGSDLKMMITGHLQGCLIATIMKELLEKNFFNAFKNLPDLYLSMDDLGDNFSINRDTLSLCADILSDQGWARKKGRNISLTQEGVIAGLAAPQYLCPVSYMPLFSNVQHLLFAHGIQESKDDEETHIDRKTDIEFSGIVFKNSCLKPFLEMALPLFDSPDLNTQPEAVVDTGAGDGTLLVELFKAIRENTQRGRALEEFPLKMVGIEYNRVAEDVCRSNILGARVPGTTLSGDISDPSGIAKGLIEAGIDPENVLHVSKSVIHNRPYSRPSDMEAANTWQPLTGAVFTEKNGDLIPARHMEYNLLEFFRDWTPWTRRHGMIAVEAHTVDPELVQTNIGYLVVTSLEASHGYSNQYLMEREAFERIAHSAGYRSLSTKGIGEEILPYPLLSINHFRP